MPASCDMAEREAAGEGGQMSEINITEWPLTKLRTITTKIGSGATPRGGKESYKNDGITLIRSLNVYDFKFENEGLAFIDDNQAEELSNVEVQPHDILLNITGASVARCCMVPNKLLPARVNQHVAIVRVNPKVANPYFVLYSINSPQYKQHLLTLAQGGATREALTKDTIGDFEVPLPPLPTQRKIASILSAYDDLIENNTRRIKILEEMAQALYREWFVKFRFPGHEKVGMVKSELGLVPEGWEVMSLSDSCKSIDDGDWIETKDQSGSDYRLIQVSNIGIGEFVETGNFRYVSQETFNRLKCNEVKPGDILVSRMPTPIGRAWLVHKIPWRIITAVDVAIVRPDPTKINPLFCVHHLNSPSNLEKTSKYAAGTTRPRITRRDLISLPILVPHLSVQLQFSELGSKTYALSNALREKCNNLRRTRDLLLPKLISGEVDVENIDVRMHH